MLWTALTTSFPLCLCVWLCTGLLWSPAVTVLLGLVCWGIWWWDPGFSEELEEPPVRTPQPEEQELLLMESLLSSSPLLVLLFLHMKRFMSIFPYTFTDQSLHWLCSVPVQGLPPFPLAFLSLVSCVLLVSALLISFILSYFASFLKYFFYSCLLLLFPIFF